VTGAHCVHASKFVVSKTSLFISLVHLYSGIEKRSCGDEKRERGRAGERGSNREEV